MVTIPRSGSANCSADQDQTLTHATHRHTHAHTQTHTLGPLRAYLAVHCTGRWPSTGPPTRCPPAASRGSTGRCGPGTASAPACSPPSAPDTQRAGGGGGHWGTPGDVGADRPRPHATALGTSTKSALQRRPGDRRGTPTSTAGPAPATQRRTAARGRRSRTARRPLRAGAVKFPHTMPMHMAVLRGEKKTVPKLQFCKKTVCSSYVQRGWVAIGSWRLAVAGDWQLAVGRWRLVTVGAWRRLVAGGWWSLGAVLEGGPQRKKVWVPEGPPLTQPCECMALAGGRWGALHKAVGGVSAPTRAHWDSGWGGGAPPVPPPLRRISGLCHVCTGGRQHKSAERKWARQWPIRPEVPFCHRTWDTKMPVGRPQRCKAVPPPPPPAQAPARSGK